MADATSSRSPRDRAARLFKNPADAWEERTRLVKREAEAEREANPPAPPIEKPRRARKIITS